MSLRVDSSSLISGALVCGNRGLGVLGSAVPSTGDNGAGYLYNDLTLPADANKEVRGLILTTPSAGSLFAYEDSSFEFSGAPDGAYTFTYRLFVDGVDSGVGTVDLQVGAFNTEITCSIGTAGALGYGAVVYQNVAIACSSAVAAASGFSATLSSRTSTLTAEDIAAIAAAVLASLQATAIPVDLQTIKGQPIAGTGTEADPWGPA